MHRETNDIRNSTAGTVDSIKLFETNSPVAKKRKFRFLPSEEKFPLNLDSEENTFSHSPSLHNFVPTYSDNEDSILKIYLHQIRQIPTLSKSEEMLLFIKIDKHKKMIRESIREIASFFPGIKQDWEQLNMSEIEQLLTDLDTDANTDLPAKAQAGSYLQYLFNIIKRGQQQIQIAKNRIIESNLRLVVYIAKKYHSKGMTLLDLIQEGSTGLMTAVDRFEYQRGAKFSAYASWWIQQSIGYAIANQGRIIRLPAYMNEILRKVTLAREQFKREKSRLPDNQEIAEMTDLPLRTIEKLSKAATDVSSLDDFIDEDKDNNIMDFIEDKRVETPEHQVTMIFLKEELEQALKSLPSREEKIIRLRYGIDDGYAHSLQEIGSIFNLSKERVRQLETRALDRLRHPARSAKLREFFA